MQRPEHQSGFGAWLWGPAPPAATPVLQDRGFKRVIDGDQSDQVVFVIDDRQLEHVVLSHPGREGHDIRLGVQVDHVKINDLMKPS
jgi:hypothetical protein